MSIFTEAITYRSCSTTSSARQSTDERSSPQKWMKSSKRSVWRYRTGTTSYSLKSEPTKTTCISSSSPYLLTAPRSSYGPSRALRPEKSSPECPRSKSTSGVENSGPMATTSARLVVTAAKRKSNATLRPRDDKKNTSSSTLNNSNYSEEFVLSDTP